MIKWLWKNIGKQILGIPNKDEKVTFEYYFLYYILNCLIFIFHIARDHLKKQKRT